MRILTILHRFPKFTVSLLLFLTCSKQILASPITINDFSAFTADFYENTWFGGSPAAPQFVQNSGYITIQPVNGGNPTDYGHFLTNYFPSIVDLTNGGLNTHIALTARWEPGNTLPQIWLNFTDINLNFAAMNFSGFTTSFTTVMVAMSDYPGIDWTQIIDWAIAGGGFTPTFNARFSVDHLAAVPEPHTFGFLACGLVALGAMRRRRKNS